MEREDHTTAEVSRLSLPAQLTVAVVAAVVAVAVAVHLAMVFLHVAPSNTVSKEHGDTIDEYIYPEFEQNWKLFAPNPLQQNVAIEVRAEIRTPEGGTSTTGWKSLSAQDGAAIRHNLLPSHTQQNVLRRAWDFYVGSHDAQDQPIGERGVLFGQYLKRIVMHRLGTEEDGGTVRRVQVRSATTPVGPPPWSDEKRDTRTVHRELPWWTVTAADVPEGAGR
ncbi:hypothetical protein IHE55_14880 [Streptomyces pactum]|uniref:Uncharacterized protein n=1 Tax=Streptomyces pactum TaxID=68249 RepID=A0ABS0NLM5_9ACTN|nr:DUF5819 family protein [Streptomyces pactum]MBH5336002.1 hypothetical protein [Streptomyces pactum]